MTAGLQVVIEESFYRNMVTMVAVPKSAFHEGNPRLDSKSVGIRKRILFFFAYQISTRSHRSWGVKGTEESKLGNDSSCLIKKHNVGFWIYNSVLDFLKINARLMQHSCQLNCVQRSAHTRGLAPATSPCN